MNPNDNDFTANLKDRFQQLPKSVQEAITSADVEKHLRDLASTQKLHLDQWAKLENEVMLALLGFQRVEDLPQNLEKEVGVSKDVAAVLAADISKAIFEPVRQELERTLQSPSAVAKAQNDVEKVRQQELAMHRDSMQQRADADGPLPPASTTPAADVQASKITRAPISETYKPGILSTERKAVHDDPYREPPV